MARFCIQCGSPTDPETGFCPNCDAAKAEQAQAPSKFCTACGSTKNEEGQCPNCDAVKEEPIQAPSKFCTVCGSPKNEAGVCPNCSKNTAAPEASEKPKKAKAKKAEKAPKPPKAPKAKKSSGKKPVGVTVFLTVLLSIFLFILLLASSAVFTVRYITLPQNIEKIIDTVDIEDAINELVTFKDSKGKKIDFAEYIAAYAKNELDVKIKESKVDDLLKTPLVTSFISEQADKYIDALLSGGNAAIERDDVEDFLKDNGELINKKLGIELEDEDFEAIAEKIITDKTEKQLQLSNIKKEMKDLSFIFISAQIGFSYITLASLILLSALLIFLMFLNKPSQAVLSMGIIFIIIGFIYGAGGLVSMLIPEILEAIIIFEFIENIISFVTSFILILAAILFGSGVVLLIIRAIVLACISAFKKKKRKALGGQSITPQNFNH